MDIKQLTYFKKVVEIGNITKAAKSLNISQSAVTQSVQALEKELNVVLFERFNRKMNLSVAGRVFLNRVDRILEEVHLATEELVPFVNIGSSITVASSSGSAGKVLVANVESLLAPVKLNIERLENRAAIEAVSKRKADVGIVSVPIDDDALESIHFYSDHISLVVDESNTLASLDHIDLQDLQGKDLVFCRDQGIIGAASQSLIVAILREQIDTTFTMERSIDLFVDKLNEPGGIYVITSARMSENNLLRAKTKKVIPFVSDEIKAEHYLIYRREDEKRLSSLIEAVQNIKDK